MFRQWTATLAGTSVTALGFSSYWRTLEVMSSQLVEHEDVKHEEAPSSCFMFSRFMHSHPLNTIAGSNLMTFLMLISDASAQMISTTTPVKPRSHMGILNASSVLTVR